MAKINIKNLITEKGLETILQILTLIIGIIAFAFIVGDLSKEIKIVSAAETAGTVLTSETQNNPKLGCCFDKDEGLCDPNSEKTKCESQTNGLFFGDKFLCDISECRQGCCILGTEAQFVTEKRCSKLSQLYGLPSKWDASISDEISCISKAQAGELGACVIPLQGEDKNTCKFTTKEDCASIQGQFHKSYLCSNAELNTNCKKQFSTGCAEGKDEIYWFDSCGNRENIYSSNKVQSWNNGKVLAKEQSCNSNSQNIGSGSCGNCNYELGSICGTYRPGVDKKISDGEYACRNLNCKNAPGNAGKKQDRINGESWCVYDGQIGEAIISTKTSIPGIDPNFLNKGALLSADVVGSRHWRYSCINGEVKVEPCADYRKEICVQDEKKLSGGKKIDNAFCRVNMWESCILLNGQTGCEKDCIDKCNTNPDCRIQNVEVDSNFKFNTCVPKYPPGFDLASTSGLNEQIESQLGNLGGLSETTSQLSNLGGSRGGTSASQVCGMASKTCTVIYAKGCPGGWKCKSNCNCMDIDFTLQMNNLCVSLGDCGAYTNIAGNVTDKGYSVSKKGDKGHAPPRLNNTHKIYSIFAKAVAGQHADPGFFNSIGFINNLPMFLEGYGETGAGGGGGSPGMFSPTTLIPTLGTGVVATAVDLALSSLGPGILGWGPFLGTGAIAAIVIFALMQLFGCGKIKTVEITFECKPWTQPILSDDCAFCNKDLLKSCSKYRCESLGINCQIINEDSDGECVDKRTETKVPTITPYKEILNASLYRYEAESTNGFRIRDINGNCIQAFTPLLFGVQTDVFAQCKISTKRNFEEGETTYFFEQNKFTKNHTSATYLPSVDSIIASETSNVDEFNQARNNEEIYTYVLNQVGDINFYVKCANINGQENIQDYQINFCVKPGPDLTPPIVVATAPADNTIVAFNASEQQMILFVNEPAECRWDVVKPTSTDMLENYNLLKNTMDCNTDVNSGTLLGYMCTTILPITAQENKFYFLCRDQPWLEENSSRNLGAYNGGIYEYTLKKSESELKIISISPNGTIIRGVEPVTINLEVETSGGADSGIAICYYKLNKLNSEEILMFNQVKFYETGTNKHVQILTNMYKGNYSAEINCADTAGNTANGEGSFKLELDSTYPEVTRVYNDLGNLVVLTNEDATCKLTTDNSLGCNFDFYDENITIMGGSLSKIHSIGWNAKIIHYIKCEDIWENKPGTCSIIVQPEGLMT